MKKISSLCFVFALFATIYTQAQNVGIGATTFTPNASAGLDVDFSNKGLLIPRVALTATNTSTPITSAATSLLVYNTATAGAAPNNVTPGYYYWDGTNWLRFFTGNDGWKITGNSNTAIATNFLGTIDNVPFAIRTNNIERMRITGGAAGAGQVVINSTSPTTDDAFSSYATATRLQAVSGYASAISGGTGVYGISNDNAGVWGQASNGVGIYGVNNSAALGAVSGYNDNAIGTAGIFAGNGLTGGMYDPAGGGIAGTGGTNGYGVYGWNYNGSNSERYGYLGSRTQGAYGQFNANAYGILGTALAGGTNNVGLWGHAANSSGGINVGLAVNSGETVISNVAATGGANLPRNFGGSIFTKLSTAVATGGRIYWMTGTGGFVFYVNSTASADYSEYFKTADRSLGVGEIVAIDPENANSVRRARPNDVANIVGVVSIGGTRYNDDSKGERHNDPNYINIGLLGQVPVLVSTENGNIKPGDALTASKIYRGRVAKATGACRIVGYAITSFPYVDGEQNYEVDILGTDKLRLKADHVMCYLNPTWYEPADITLTDGIEPATVESAFDMQKRVNAEIEAANPNKAQFEKNKEEMSKIHTDIQRERKTPKQAKPLNKKK